MSTHGPLILNVMRLAHITMMTHANPKTVSLPHVSVAVTSLGLAISVILSALVAMDIVSVAWNAELLPWLTLLALIPFCLISFVVSCWSFYLHRDMPSVIAILLGVIAIVASTGTFCLIVIVSIARHPV